MKIEGSAALRGALQGSKMALAIGDTPGHSESLSRI